MAFRWWISGGEPTLEDSVLEASIVSAVGRAGKRGSFDLAAVTTFGWDRAHVLHAYSSPEVVERRLGFPWPGSQASASVVQDHFQLIVFVKGRAVVRWIDHVVSSGRFDVGDTPIERRDSVLDVTSTEDDGIVVTRRGVAPPVRRLVHYENGKVVEVDPSEIDSLVPSNPALQSDGASRRR